MRDCYCPACGAMIRVKDDKRFIVCERCGCVFSSAFWGSPQQFVESLAREDDPRNVPTREEIEDEFLEFLRDSNLVNELVIQMVEETAGKFGNKAEILEAISGDEYYKCWHNSEGEVAPEIVAYRHALTARRAAHRLRLRILRLHRVRVSGSKGAWAYEVGKAPDPPGYRCRTCGVFKADNEKLECRCDRRGEDCKRPQA